MLRTFEDLVNGCLRTGRRHQLLYVYMRLADAPRDEAARQLFPGQDLEGLDGLGVIRFDAHEPVVPGLTFADMRAHADAYSPDWDVVFVMTARNADDSPVTDDQAKAFLADMRGRIMAGEFPAWAPIFDRQGALKGVDRARPIDLAGPARRAD